MGVRAHGLINGLLRALSNEQGDPHLLSWEALSLPKWLYERWVSSLGEERTVETGKSFLRERPLVIRVNTGASSVERVCEKLSEKEISYSVVPGIPTAIAIKDGIAIEAIPGFWDGWFYAQDIGSIEAVLEAGLISGERVLDCCAAPGGKAIFAAELVGENGFVEARDKSEEKVSLILENIKRCPYSNIIARVLDAKDPDSESIEAFDVVFG